MIALFLERNRDREKVQIPIRFVTTTYALVVIFEICYQNSRRKTIYFYNPLDVMVFK